MNNIKPSYTEEFKKVFYSMPVHEQKSESTFFVVTQRFWACIVAENRLTAEKAGRFCGKLVVVGILPEGYDFIIAKKITQEISGKL